jgi:hypothetical protein
VLGNNIFGITPPGVARYLTCRLRRAFVSLMRTPRYRGLRSRRSRVTGHGAGEGQLSTVNPQYASIVANKALSVASSLDIGRSQRQYPAHSLRCRRNQQPPAASGSEVDKALAARA